MRRAWSRATRVGHEARGGLRLRPTQRERLATPSFLAQTESLRRVRDRARASGGVDEIWSHNEKLAAVSLANELGLRVPATLVDPTCLDRLELPDAAGCVVKPLNGFGARGVAPLVSSGDGRWHSLFDLDAGPRTWSAWRRELATRFVASGKLTDEFFVEELVPGPAPHRPPIDWKALCIGGRVALIQERQPPNQRGGVGRYRVWTRDFDALGAVPHHPGRHDPSLPPPHHPAELIQTAERVACALPGLFVRVDLYDPPPGVVFGEITPQPGPQLWFGAAWDRRLGVMWEEAQAKAMATGSYRATPPRSSDSQPR